MAARDITRDASEGARAPHVSTNGVSTPRRRFTTETKAAFKTTELITYVAAVVAVLIAAAMVDESNAGGFGAQQAWLYVTILTVGYMVSRGLAKSGSPERYTDDDGRR